MAIYHQTPKGALLGGRPEEGDIIRGSRQGTVSSVAGANRITPRPEDGGIPPILPPQPDNVAGSLSGNTKAQSLGENLWEGEALAQQRASKRQVGANPVPIPGSEFDDYGGMFSQPLAQTGEIKAANKQRRQARRERAKGVREQGEENYSYDGYHTGEYNKRGISKEFGKVPRYSRKNPPPLNQNGETKYKQVGVQELEESGKIFEDNKGKFVVNKEKTGTSRDTLRLPKNVWKSPQKGNNQGSLIDDVEYEQISKETNKK